MKSMRQAASDYLAMRRALGFKLYYAERCLIDFLKFAEERGAIGITSALAVEWAVSKTSARPEKAAERLRVIRAFARHHIGNDPATEIPPTKLLPYSVRRRQPYLYTDDEISLLLKHALCLPPQDGLRPWTCHCFFGLLSVTGMRVGEALRLKVEDIDLVQDVLTIRETKFGKSRLLPIQSSTRAVLLRYKALRDQYLQGHPESHFFVSGRRRRLSGSAIRYAFQILLKQTGLLATTPRPRLHDLRHRFAVQVLLQWYRAGEDVERHLPELSTYLGHVCVENTYWYLSAYPELMTHAVSRLERRWEVQA